MKKIIIIFVIATIISSLFIFTVKNSSAYTFGDMGGFLDTTREETGLSTRQSSDIVAGIINSLLALMGAVFVIIMVYGGVTWMISGGDETKIKKAKSAITSAIVGLVLVSGAYTISYFLASAIETGSGGTGGASVSNKSCTDYGGQCKTVFQCSAGGSHPFSSSLCGNEICCVTCAGIGGQCKDNYYCESGLYDTQTACENAGVEWVNGKTTCIAQNQANGGNVNCESGQFCCWTPN